MIALDTNVLVRFLVADDEEQNRRATEFVKNVMQKTGHFTFQTSCWSKLFGC